MSAMPPRTGTELETTWKSLDLWMCIFFVSPNNNSSHVMTKIQMRLELANISRMSSWMSQSKSGSQRFAEATARHVGRADLQFCLISLEHKVAQSGQLPVAYWGVPKRWTPKLRGPPFQTEVFSWSSLFKDFVECIYSLWQSASPNILCQTVA